MYIETERLIITEFTPDMAKVVQENSMDEDNKRFVPDEVWETVEEAEETLDYLISQYGAFEGPLVYPVMVKDTRDNVGYVQLCPIDDNQWEIGYHIADKYTGKGYATEAAGAFLPVIAEEAGITEVYGICLAENKASIAVLKKLGFKDVFRGVGKYQGVDREIVKAVWEKQDFRTDIIQRLNDKDDKAAYEFAKVIMAESAASDKYLEMIPAFADMLQAKSSFVRARAFLLICSQARWACAGQIGGVFDRMKPLLNDPKPTVVRQCLNGLQEVVRFRPEMTERIREALSEMDPGKYKDSMSPLIRKDMETLLKSIQESNNNTVSPGESI